MPGVVPCDSSAEAMEALAKYRYLQQLHKIIVVTAVLFLSAVHNSNSWDWLVLLSRDLREQVYYCCQAGALSEQDDVGS